MRTVIGRSLDADRQARYRSEEDRAGRRSRLAPACGDRAARRGLLYPRSRQPERHLYRGARQARARPTLQIEGSRPGGAWWCYIAVSERLAAHDHVSRMRPRGARRRQVLRSMRPGAVASGFLGRRIVADAADAADGGRALKGGIEIVELTSRPRSKIATARSECATARPNRSHCASAWRPNPAEDVVEEAPVVEAPKPRRCACRRSQRAAREDGGAETAAGADQRDRRRQRRSRTPRVRRSRRRRAPSIGRRHPVGGRGRASTAAMRAKLPKKRRRTKRARRPRPPSSPETEQAPSSRRRRCIEAAPPTAGEDLGEVFGRVLALSQTISHPAFQRATRRICRERARVPGLCRRGT